VLEQLDDAEVQAVISSVSEKQAAAILQNFPPARAAVISKAVLRSTITPKP
jgi:flagellar motility protein MotE (MotC chaperone)